MEELVLVVHPDLDFIEAVEDVLTSAHIRTRSVRSGEEAFAEMGRAHVALVLLGAELPRAGADRFRHAQLSAPELRGVPVVAMTTDRDVERVKLRLAAAAALKCPFSFDDLLEVVRRFVGRGPPPRDPF